MDPIDINVLKQQNSGYKTANIDGILFLVNDSSDELGYHYGNNIRFNPIKLNNILARRKKRYSGYLFTIIPDKSVLLADFLKTRLSPNVCSRPHVDIIKQLDFVVDSYDTIVAGCKNDKCYVPCDTHSPPYVIYLYYTTIAKKLGLVPVSVEKSHMDINFGDLALYLNNGTRDNLQNVEKCTVPVVKLNNSLHNFQIIDLTKKNYLESDNNLLNYSEQEVNDSYLGKRAKFDIDFFVNYSVGCSNARVLYFHDSNMSNVIKRCFSSHFKFNYFRKSSFDKKIVRIIKPDLIIEETMERFLNTYRND